MDGWTKDCGWSISSNINPAHSLFVCGLMCNICRRDKITRFGFRPDTDATSTTRNKKNNKATTTTCLQFTLTGADDDDGQVEDQVETIRRHVDVKANNLKSSSSSSYVISVLVMTHNQVRNEPQLVSNQFSTKESTHFWRTQTHTRVVLMCFGIAWCQYFE